MTAEAQLPRAAIAASIQRERSRVGISLTELARRAGVAKSTLSQLESGTGNPSLETMWALAVALGIPFSQLIEPPASPIQVIRAGEGPAVAASEADYVATLLTASPPGVRRDLYRITAEPGQARESAPHARGTIEHVYLAAGRERWSARRRTQWNSLPETSSPIPATNRTPSRHSAAPRTLSW
ncbi:helix-turn-helix transcriptional regulator [Ruania zhangjianzhongii]|uniref:helix-turn-helix domain-containing protein n=1 Tax=Ruania zhangjianzhongii TaxID=2603206 RepID=UPI0031450C79